MASTYFNVCHSHAKKQTQSRCWNGEFNMKIPKLKVIN